MCEGHVGQRKHHVRLGQRLVGKALRPSNHERDFPPFKIPFHFQPFGKLLGRERTPPPIHSYYEVFLWDPLLQFLILGINIRGFDHHGLHLRKRLQPL